MPTMRHNAHRVEKKENWVFLYWDDLTFDSIFVCECGTQNPIDRISCHVCNKRRP
jgi:hypothetical protein